jgi:uncharacterized protein
VLVVTGGHSFDRDPFFDVFAANHEITWHHAQHPDARALFTPEAAEPWDVFVLYDMPGITFTKADPPAIFETPSAEFTAGFQALLDAGKGFVFLHHALASWPAWPGFADIVGGRFHYQPARLRGVHYPDSGYLLDVRHTVQVMDPAHPICAGVPASFELTDELYQCPVFADDVTPLMRTTFDMASRQFFSADLAIRGKRHSNEGWSHPVGSDLVAWVKHVGGSPIAYLQFGDGPSAYANPTYRLIVANTIRWAATA